MAPGLFQVKDTGEYLRRLKTSFVIVSPEERKELIAAEVNKAAAETGGIILPDEELLEIVTHLVEYPLAIRGGFSKDFLSLPREVLISAMRSTSGTSPCGFLRSSSPLLRDGLQHQAPGHRGRGPRQRAGSSRPPVGREILLSGRPESPALRPPRRVEKGRLPLQLGTSYEKVMRIGRLAEAISARVPPISRRRSTGLLCSARAI